MKYDQIKEWYIKNDNVFFASFEITQKCNFNCNHCYCPDKQAEAISITDAKKIVDKLYGLGCFLLIFTGGEVFSCDYFDELYIYAKKKGFIIDIMTNGSLINDKRINMLSKYPPHIISITLYGASKEDYGKFTGREENYTKVMNNLEKLKAANISFNIRTVATKTLRDSIKNSEFDKIAQMLDVDFRYDPIIFPKISGDKTTLSECLPPKEIAELESCNQLRTEEWVKIFKIKDAFVWKCRAGINSLMIDYKGDAHICGMYRKEGVSFLNEDMDVILKHLKQIHFRHEDIIKKNECSKCENRRFCKWCPAYSQVYNGNDHSKVTFLCELTNARRAMFETQ